MFWNRKSNKKVESVSSLPKVDTALSMSRVADEMRDKITRMFYNELIEKIRKQSWGGNKSYSVPETFFDTVTVSYKDCIEKEVISPTVDFTLLKELLEEKGFNVVSKANNAIVGISWVNVENKE